MTARLTAKALASRFLGSKFLGSKGVVASTLVTALTLSGAAVSGQAQAATLNWYDLWDTSSTASSRTFGDVGGSGINVNVEYSTNMYWSTQNNGRVNIYDNGTPQKNVLNDTHPLDQYDGILRMTNDRSDDPESVFVKLTFSEAVHLDEFWVGSLSTIGDAREWMSVSAYASDEVDFNNLESYADQRVAASKYDTYENFFGNTNGDYHVKADSDSLVMLDADVTDKVYTTGGVGSQGDGDYGRVFFEYSDKAVQSLVIEHFTTKKDNSAKSSSRYTSVAVSPNSFFTRATTPTEVPEPMSIFGLLAVGTLGVSTSRKRRLA